MLNFLTILLLFTALAFANSAFLSSQIVKREALGDEPQQDCMEQCQSTGKSTKSCEQHCTVLTPMERHVTPLLDADCVKQCNGGEVSGANPLKPECEEKCLFKEGNTPKVRNRAKNENPLKISLKIN